MCLLDNREVRKGWSQLKDAVAGQFTKHGAKVLSARRWDERRLAYPIRGQQRGTYLLVYFAADTQAVTGIRRDLQFNEALLRFLLVDCEEVPATAYEPEAEFDVSAIPADDSVAPPPATKEPVAEAQAAQPAQTAQGETVS
jgi:ribosomal protein S6